MTAVPDPCRHEDGPRLWHCGPIRLSLTRPLVMGICNVTPDSFSDGGRFVTSAGTGDSGSTTDVDVSGAVSAALALAVEGADIIDIGGESTRPGSVPVSLADEERRVVPIIEALVGPLHASHPHVAISVDTRHAAVARSACTAGADIINDISGFRDSEMIQTALDTGAGCVVMHMLGEPATMQADPRYHDVVAEVGIDLVARVARLLAAGVPEACIVIDPGIGFGKTTAHNLEILRRLPEIVGLGYPVLIGASRKRFIGAVLGEDDPAERLEGSLVAAMWAVEHGASVVRVHDVAPTVRTIRMTRAIACGEESS